jgi:hypothetical protein
MVRVVGRRIASDDTLHSVFVVDKVSIPYATNLIRFQMVLLLINYWEHQHGAWNQVPERILLFHLFLETDVCNFHPNRIGDQWLC